MRPMLRPALHMTKAQTAEWLGYGSDIEAMDREHDELHRRLAKWLGFSSSYSLRQAEGEPLSPADLELAALEEDAVLHVQRLIQTARGR